MNYHRPFENPLLRRRQLLEDVRTALTDESDPDSRASLATALRALLHPAGGDAPALEQLSPPLELQTVTKTAETIKVDDPFPIVTTETRTETRVEGPGLPPTAPAPGQDQAVYIKEVVIPYGLDPTTWAAMIMELEADRPQGWSDESWQLARQWATAILGETTNPVESSPAPAGDPDKS